MPKKSKLLSALDAHKGRDYEAEKRKKVVKAAEKRKKQKAQTRADSSDEDEQDDDNVPQLINGDTPANHTNGADSAHSNDDFEAFASSSDEEPSTNTQPTTSKSSTTIPQPPQEDPETSASASASEPDSDQESDLSLSDLSATDLEDTIPHQRLTINNALALTNSLNRIAIINPHSPRPLQHHNSLISTLPPCPQQIPDPNDDESRELTFYKIARDATVTARTLLKKEKVPFTRPADYFAEMVKTDEHMGRVKRKLVEEASGRKASEEARRLRDAKRFGKQVQVAREQERAKERRDTLGKIQELKRKRKDNDTGRVTEGDDLFEEINVDTNSNAKKRQRRDDGYGNSGSRGGDGATKRQGKDKKFGFGGKKRFSKSGTAESSADMKGFSVGRMKGRGGGGRGVGRGGRGGRGGGQRLGKSRRSAGRG